ncbi:DUF2332 domain-containing protein [Naasia sp. SYSU D00057]|uniref:DUF2332 domain-containing protein n=1 Tax=Naasia sp. SYSU D00057 TaxID=2817380 RepID=UPI001B30B22C|nr:DUF2332 domain-containing protein [Naasia sp. SYSU D00057]
MTSDTADWYLRFADGEAAGRSVIYEEWARGVAADPEVLALLDGLPEQKRQPNLVFSTARLLGAPSGIWPVFREWLLAHWDAVAEEARVRSTQTNEPGRCAALLPALALVPGPLALIEVGASAGLTLIPDRYAYRYDDDRRGEVRIGDGDLVLECATAGGVPLPSAPPDVRWRCGIDLHPLNLSDGDVHWLETLVWPEAEDRRRRIRAAVAIARRDPPRIVRGDVVDALREVVAQVPDGLTPVVVSSGTLVYVPGLRRAAFRHLVRELGCRLLALEGMRVFPDLTPERVPATPGTPFLVTLDESPVAVADAHGRWLTWL